MSCRKRSVLVFFGNGLRYLNGTFEVAVESQGREHKVGLRNIESNLENEGANRKKNLLNGQEIFNDYNNW